MDLLYKHKPNPPLQKISFNSILKSQIEKISIDKLLVAVIAALGFMGNGYAGAEPTKPKDKPNKFNSQLFDAPTLTSKGTVAAAPFDPNAPPKPSIELAPNLYLGGFVTAKSETNRNLKMNDDPDDDFSYFEADLSLAFLYDPSPYFQVYANPVLRKRVAFEEQDNEFQDPALEINLAFMSLNNLFLQGSTFSFGRQRFKDPRRWIWGTNLDAARFSYHKDQFSIEFSASKKNMFAFDILNADPESSGDRWINYYGYFNYKINHKNDIGLFVLHQADQTNNPRDHQNPVFVGIQAEGEVIKHLDYWFQGALVRGSDSGKTIRGEGMDLGLTYQFDHELKPSITLGYAYGSGDDNPNDGVDKAFRQSRFQDNEDKYNGVVRLKYYGELLDPRLSNLKVMTAGLGIRPTRRSSVDLVYHYFRQEYGTNDISGDNLDVDPTGRSKDLGHELDLVAGYQEFKNLNTKLVLGYFWPGRAFPETARDGAFLAELQFRYSF